MIFDIFEGLACGGKAVSPGRVLFVRSSTHLHQEDSVMVGEDLVYSLTVTLLYCLLCQPPFWGCQSRPKLVPQEAEASKARGLARTIGAGTSKLCQDPDSILRTSLDQFVLVTLLYLKNDQFL